MDDAVKYSIIIPHYNCLEGLRRLLDTIPDSAEFQVIVVDDQSTEAVAELLEYVQGQDRIQFFRNDSETKNAGKSRNIGLQHARGKWVFFADADDFFCPSFEEKARRFQDDDSDVIYFPPISTDAAGGRPSDRHILFHQVIRRYLRKPGHRREVVLRYRLASAWSKMIRRDVLLKHQIDFEEIEVANDVMFSAQLAYHMESFAICDEPIYCITKGVGTLTTATSDERWRLRRDVFIRRCLYLRERLSPSDWRVTGLSGKSQLLSSLGRNKGITTFIETYKLLRKHRIRLFAWDGFLVAYYCEKARMKLKGRKT